MHHRHVVEVFDSKGGGLGTSHEIQPVTLQLCLATVSFFILGSLANNKDYTPNMTLV